MASKNTLNRWLDNLDDVIDAVALGVFANFAVDCATAVDGTSAQPMELFSSSILLFTTACSYLIIKDAAVEHSLQHNYKV